MQTVMTAGEPHRMNGPKLACPNFNSNVLELRSFALDCGFHGIDWTLRAEDLPKNRLEEKRLVNSLSRLAPLEVRFHLFFPGWELGDSDTRKARSSKHMFYAALELIAKLAGRYATLHVGLDRNSMEGISWNATIFRLRDIAIMGRRHGIRVCLENLITGWTAKPNLYEKLIRKANCWGTLDVGHAHVCSSVTTKAYDIEDFALPHPEKILSAHIYHEETTAGHMPPDDYSDLDNRLRLLQRLPLCDWWVLELREEKSLLQTLDCVRAFLKHNATRAAM